HQANDVRLELERDGNDLRGVGHFQVEAGLDDFAQLPGIAVLDVAPVFPEVGGDAVRARRLTVERGGNRVRLALRASTVARFAERRDVIDVYTQLQHTLRLWFSRAAVRNLNILGRTLTLPLPSRAKGRSADILSALGVQCSQEPESG